MCSLLSVPLPNTLLKGAEDNWDFGEHLEGHTCIIKLLHAPSSLKVVWPLQCCPARGAPLQNDYHVLGVVCSYKLLRAYWVSQISMFSNSFRKVSVVNYFVSYLLFSLFTVITAYIIGLLKAANSSLMLCCVLFVCLLFFSVFHFGQFLMTCLPIH